MILRQFQGSDVSLYGMGCMRLPKLADAADDAGVDETAVQEMVDLAMEEGVTYYDTAWGYHNGVSEGVMGRCLAKYPRESFYLADKFPGYDSANWGKHEEIFAEQLQRCQVSYFDFYLVHNVCEMNIDAYLDAEGRYGDVAYLKQMRDEGKIAHLGFSVHGNYDVMKAFLEKYGEWMEFVQILLNYIDYSFQDANRKLELAAEYGLPVIVMEPLRGGMLARATEAEEAQLRAQRPEMGVVGWAERYLQGFEQVFCILNGASSLEQLRENLSYFEDEEPLGEGDLQVLSAMVSARLASGVEPCTACRYCTPHCPQGIDIPKLLKAYNEHKFTGGGFLVPMLIPTIPEGKRPKDCTACGSCAAVCPQGIDIPGTLAKLSAMFDGAF